MVMNDVIYCDGPYACAENADALVIVTEWEQFRALDFDRLKQVMTQPVLVDLRNIYRPEEMARHGFVYDSVGRPPQEDDAIEVVDIAPERKVVSLKA
jgi:UDPglucose 6-dehydrogenase